MIITAGQGYWTILRRFNRNRENPAIRGAAIRDMDKLEANNAAILRRIVAFKARTAPRPTGPQIA